MLIPTSFGFHSSSEDVHFKTEWHMIATGLASYMNET